MLPREMIPWQFSFPSLHQIHVTAGMKECRTRERDYIFRSLSLRC